MTTEEYTAQMAEHKALIDAQTARKEEEELARLTTLYGSKRAIRMIQNWKEAGRRWELC
jgi:hypothetical protein